MRRNGVSNFPDPGGDGNIQVPSTIDKRSPAFLKAVQECRALDPRGALTEQAVAQLQRQMLAFAACMRAHGVTQFPDPLLTQGHIVMPEGAEQRIDWHSHTFTAAAAACRDKLSVQYFSKLIAPMQQGGGGGK